MKNALKILSIICLMFVANNIYALECNNENYQNKKGIEMSCEQIKNLENMLYTI